MFHIRKHATRFFCCVVLAICNLPANAAMIYMSADRAITGGGSQLDRKIETDDAMGSFTDDLLNSGYYRDANNSIVGSVSASASQTSTMTGDLIRGLGRGSGFGSGPAEGVGRSDMHIEFKIEQSAQFTLTGQLRLAPHGEGLGLNGSSAMIRVSGPDGIALEVLMDQQNLPNHLGSVDFSGGDRLTGEFPAGTYVLEAMSEGHGSDGLTRCVDFDFTFSAFEAVALPEPSGLGLLSLAGIALLVGRRRRR